MTAKNLPTRVREVTDKAAVDLVAYINSSRWIWYSRLHTLALEAAGVTANELELMGEHDDTNPKYTLYYAELTNLLMKTLGKSIDDLSF